MALDKLLPVSSLCGSIPINLMEETMPGKKTRGQVAIMLIEKDKLAKSAKPKKKAAKRPKTEYA